MSDEHKFSFRSHNVEHVGMMDDEVAEWFSALLVMERSVPTEIVVGALKAALRTLIVASEEVA